MRKYLQKLCFLLMVILTVSLALPSKVFAQSDSNLKPNPVAEAWVLDQIKAGKPANLKERFTKEDERVLSATFLESLLLTPSESITRNGVHIENAIFIDPLDLKYAVVDYELELVFCRFEDSVDISESHFTQNLSFIGSTFTSSVNLFRIQIDKTLKVGKANFENSTNFNHIRVDGDVLLREAKFAGPVDFGFAEVGNSFNANDARFNNTEETVNFGNMKVESLHLDRAKFVGPVDIRYTEVSNNFEAVETKFEGKNLAVNLNHIKVGDSIRLIRTTFVGVVLLSNLQCSILHIEDVIWPSESIEESIKMDEMTYQSIIALRGGNDSWYELISLIDRSLSYDARTYKTLETFFENQGYPEKADQVYIASKKREGRETVNLILLFNWRSSQWWKELPGLLVQLVWNKFLYVFIGYGRSPGLAFLWSLGIVFLGSKVFKKEDEMVELSKKISARGKKSDANENARLYYPFWYSLDLFIAPVDLGIASRWEPKPKGKWVYSKVQMLLGWILIPIALLALIGVIK